MMTHPDMERGNIISTLHRTT